MFWVYVSFEFIVPYQLHSSDQKLREDADSCWLFLQEKNPNGDGDQEHLSNLLDSTTNTWGSEALPKEVVNVPSLAVFEAMLDRALGDMVYCEAPLPMGWSWGPFQPLLFWFYDSFCCMKMII